MIVFGLGSGRSGTGSLAGLLNCQKNTVCFHELNPVAVRHQGTIQPILNTVSEFNAILGGEDPSRLSMDLSRTLNSKPYNVLKSSSNIKILADVALYYLQYVPEVVDVHPGVRFVCLKRDRAETVRSWIKKTTIHRWPSKRVADRISSLITRTPYYESRNHWMDHDGSRWLLDPVWDKCFPHFEVVSKEEAINLYWRWYYKKAQMLAKTYPDQFRIYPIEKLNSDSGQIEILAHCGIERNQMVLAPAHDNRSG